MRGGFGQSFGFPFYGGQGSTSLAPYTFPVGLGSYPYNLDLSRWEDEFKFQSVGSLREQQDTSDAPGEQSLNPAGLWRRSMDSFHLGAGQDFYDRVNISSPFRFNESLGIDVWTRYQFGLLPDTDEKRSSGNSNLYAVVVGDYLYITDGTAILRTQDIGVDTPSFTNVTGVPAPAPTSIATDGFNVLTSHSGSGLYKTTRGAATTASHITGTVQRIAYVRGRWIATNANSVYDVSSQVYGAGPVAITAPLFTHANTDFVWKGIAEGTGFIYLAGVSGTKSVIYRTAVKEDGTALSVPTNAAELPEGEIVETIYGYLGRFLMIGTNRGWRLSFVQADGELRVGNLRLTPATVRCFEGEEEFIWFGYSNYDATHTGLGRLSLNDFVNVEALQPAFASDLMVDGAGEILTIVTFNGIRFFSVSGDGFYAEHHDGNLVESGYIDTGQILFNINEEKIGLFFDVTHKEHTGDPTHALYVSLDEGPFQSIGTHHSHSEPFVLGEATARSFEFRIELFRDASSATISQFMTSWLFRAQPVPSVSTVWSVPLLITPNIEDLFGNPHTLDTFAALDDIVRLHRRKTTTLLQLGGRGYSVVVEDYDLRVHHIINEQQGMCGFNGTCVVTLKVIAEAVE